jgi:hypothetical protein
MLGLQVPHQESPEEIVAETPEERRLRPQACQGHGNIGCAASPTQFRSLEAWLPFRNRRPFHANNQVYRRVADDKY